MEKDEFEESIKFNLVDALEYGSNTIVVANIKVEKLCIIQAFAFDFGKVFSQKKISLHKIHPYFGRKSGGSHK